LGKNTGSTHRKGRGGRLAERCTRLPISNLNKMKTKKKEKNNFHSNTYKKQKYPFVSMLFNF
jgi:hypothetical protein